MMVHMRKYAKKLGVLLLAFFVSNFLILNLTDLDGFVQRAKAASNEWAWSKASATSFCEVGTENPRSEEANTPLCIAFRNNYRGTGPLKDYGDQAFKDAGVQNTDPKLYVSKLSWVLEDKILFCKRNNNPTYANATPDFPNSSNQCIEINQAAANANSIPYTINENLKKQIGTSGNVDPVPCEYENKTITLKHDREETEVTVRVPVEGGKKYPIQAKYDQLLGASKGKASYDWSTFDLATEGFTKEEAKKCMEESFAASQMLYNAAFQAVVLAAKFLLTPGPEVVKEDGTPVNPLYEKLGSKVYLGSRMISYEMMVDAARDAAQAGLIAGAVAAGIIIIGSVLLAVFTGGASLSGIWLALSIAAPIALQAFGTFAVLGAGTSALVSFAKNEIQLSGANVYNTYSTNLKPLSQAYWMMAESAMLLATTKGQANPIRESLLSSGGNGVIRTAASEVLDPEISKDQMFATAEVNTVNQVIGVGKNVAQFLNGEVAKKMNALSGRLQSADRCGNEQSPGFLTANGFMQILCVVSIAVQEFSEYLLRSSLNMLAQTAGFSGRVPSTDESSDSMFDFLVPVEIRTPPESIIGSTTNDVGKIISKTHSLILTLVNFILLLFFIFIALSNILQIQVSTYQISKMFPQLVIGLILANASIFVIRGVMEATSYVTEFFALGGYDINQLAQSLSNIGGADKVTFFYDQATGLVKSGLVMKQATLNLFIIAAAVIVFILAFLFVIRSIVFYFLTPLSALAFFSAAVKPIGFIWKQWSKNFFNWLLMPLIASFWLWLAFQFFTATSSTAQSAFGSILGYLFGMVCMVTAIKSSVGSLSGEAKMVMDKWQGMGKQAWGATGGAAGKAVKADLKDRYMTAQNLSRYGDLKRWGKNYVEERQGKLKASESGINLRSAKKQAEATEHAEEHANEARAKAQKDFADNKLTQLQYEKKIEEIEDELDKEMKKINNKRANRVNAARQKKNIMRHLEHDLDKSVQEGVTAFAEEELAKDFKSKQGKKYNKEYALVKDTQSATQIAKAELARARAANYSGIKTSDGQMKTGAALMASERRQVTVNQASARQEIANDDEKDQKEHYDRRILVDDTYIKAAKAASEGEAAISAMAGNDPEKESKIRLMAEEHKNALKRTDQYVKAYIGRDDIVNEAFSDKMVENGAVYRDIIDGKGVLDPSSTDVKTLKEHQKRVARILSLHKMIKDGGSNYKSTKSAAVQLMKVIGPDAGLQKIIDAKFTSRDAWNTVVTENYRGDNSMGTKIDNNIGDYPTNAFKVTEQSDAQNGGGNP